MKMLKLLFIFTKILNDYHFGCQLHRAFAEELRIIVSCTVNSPIISIITQEYDQSEWFEFSLWKYPYPLTSLGLKRVSAGLAQEKEEEAMLRKRQIMLDSSQITRE